VVGRFDGHGVPVLSVLTLDDLIGFSTGVRSEDDLRRLEEYRAKYLAQD
jgi:orotate phosphoribosyltransferase